MAPKQNAFILFMMEWRRMNYPELEFREAIKEASPFWEKMSQEEREPYRQKSKNFQHARFPEIAQNLTCIGVPLGNFTQKGCDPAKKQADHNREISEIVHRSLQANEFECDKYYFIMVNYFAKKIKTEACIPAELSVSEYSLKLGVNRVYHTLVNPGNCLYGQVYEARELSKRTHNLPLPPHALGDTNLNGIFENVTKFIRPECNVEYPPIYTLTEHIPIVESVLKYLQMEKLEDGNEPVELNVYPIEYLFYVMEMSAAGKSQSNIEQEVNKEGIIFNFSRDSFEYSSDIGCEFHEDRDRSNFCTQSYVIRWGYMFSDFIARKMKMKLLPGRHLPRYATLGTDDLDKLNAESNPVVDIQLQAGTSKSGLQKRGCSRGDLLRMMMTSQCNKLG